MASSNRNGGPARWLVLLAALCAPVSAQAAGDIASGKAKAKMCAACHGLDGLSKAPDAPNLAGNGELYLASQLKAFQSGARTHPQMSVIAASLSEEDIADLTAWYSAIKVSVELPQ
jgi:cytochrome c553